MAAFSAAWRSAFDGLAFTGAGVVARAATGAAAGAGAATGAGACATAGADTARAGRAAGWAAGTCCCGAVACADGAPGFQGAGEGTVLAGGAR